MDDSSDDDRDINNYVFYKDRPEWKDVEPIPQDDGPDPVVAIDYSPEYKDVYDYFRAILKSGEKSDRALALTEAAAKANPANYTVWQYRRDILKALNKDLAEELKFLESIMMSNSKNYQVWHHRKVLVEWSKSPTEEKRVTEMVLNKDAKNYHAWQHRQWVIKTFNLFDGELKYTDRLLAEDIRNNSAWNQRYFVINNTTSFTQEVLNKEIAYTLSSIKVVTENESAWNYLKGLLLHDKEGLSNNKEVTKFCDDLYNSGCRSPFLLALIVDMCYEQISQGKKHSAYNVDRAKQLCSELAAEFDTIRAKYWQHMAEMIELRAKGEPDEGSTSTSSS